ncbi:FecR domain-containing protein [Candidatus Peregrinibacteria bacterium]|nr:FecR domain-containing protein [Candidatus Peregrinibacteria bacterium]
MNYYQYKRKAPRSKVTDFIKPFLVIVIFLGVIVAGWKFLGPSLMGGGELLSSEKVYLDIETGSARAMTAGGNEWSNVLNGIYLYEGEKLKSTSDGRITLTFFEKDMVRLDKSTEVKFASLNRDAVGGQATIEVTDGKLWVIIDKSGPTISEFTIDTGLLKLRSSGGTFALTYPGMVYVLDGSVKADILNEKDIVKSLTIGVGQELIVDKTMAADLAEGIEKEVIFALDDAFKSSNWYRWNQQQEGAVELEEEAASEEVTSEDAAETTDEETMDEETTAEEEVTEEEEEIDLNDKEPPTVPQIEIPGNNGDTVALEDVKQDIKGSVSSDTEKVIVNDYTLSRYVSGSKEFRYTANIAFGNLEVGDNDYEVIAVDKNGNKSETATITLVLSQEVYDKAKEEEGEAEESEPENSTPTASSSGGVKITSPNNGENMVTSETSFEIKGSVPEGTAKVVVNDYTLSAFSEGNTTFLYRASSTLGNLEIGELNTYTIKAYDPDDELLGSASMTIDVESGTNGEGGAPTITIPTSATTYSTTLDQLMIGGAVGKWITRVKINGANLDSYIPGSEEWKKTVTLESGDNTFEVCAEKDSEQQGCSSITINYQGQ